MPNQPSARRHTTAGPAEVPTERRNRRRLRELCDEVLASYRVATERDVITDRDRSEARALLARLTPATRG
jgi:hypothetical protein